jgi:hypothetical protein
MGIDPVTGSVPCPTTATRPMADEPLSNTRRNRLTTQPPHDKLHGRNNVQKSASRQVEAT